MNRNYHDEEISTPTPDWMISDTPLAKTTSANSNENKLDYSSPENQQRGFFTPLSTPVKELQNHLSTPTRNMINRVRTWSRDSNQSSSRTNTRGSPTKMFSFKSLPNNNNNNNNADDTNNNNNNSSGFLRFSHSARRLDTSSTSENNRNALFPQAADSLQSSRSTLTTTTRPSLQPRLQNSVRFEDTTNLIQEAYGEDYLEDSVIQDEITFDESELNSTTTNSTVHTQNMNERDKSNKRRESNTYKNRGDQNIQKDSDANRDHQFSILRLLIPDVSRISSFVARYAPCFLFCANPLSVSATDRAILFRLNVLCSIFALSQVGVGLFLCYVIIFYNSQEPSADATTTMGGNNTSFYNDTALNSTMPMENEISNVFWKQLKVTRISLAPNIWNINLSLVLIAAMGLILLIAIYFANRYIAQVDLMGALRYLWVLLWILPVQFFFVLTLFDTNRVSSVWIEKYWHGNQFIWFREQFCANNTANNKCMVPLFGGANFTNETDFCEFYYNSTDCLVYRTDAQDNMKNVTYIFYTLNGVIGIVSILLIYLITRVLERIISPTIIQRSRENNIAGWFFLPIAGSIAVGLSILKSPTSFLATTIEYSWIGYAYLISGGTYFVSASLAYFISYYSVLDAKDKKRKNVAVIVFLLTVFFAILASASVLAASLLFAFEVEGGTIIDSSSFSKMACILDTENTCTGCDEKNHEDICPEWADEDVMKIIKTVLKQSACLAGMLLAYGLGALRFGFALKRYIQTYQIDYV